MKVRKAIIPAAGMGTRVLPASKAIPKEMLNIVDKPAIQYIVEEAFNSGIEEVLILPTEVRVLLRTILTTQTARCRQRILHKARHGPIPLSPFA